MLVVTNSARSTASLGKAFASFLKKKDVVLLEGDLGGGKTTFIKGVLKGLGYRGRVLSPSFTLLRQYNAKDTLVHHVDLYRLEEADLFSFGLEDYLSVAEGFTLIEWGERLERFIPQYIKIKFLFKGQTKRNIYFSLKGYAAKRDKFLKEVLET